MYSAFETITAFVDLFNNPIGIAGGIIGVIVGLIICKFANHKAVISVICGSILVILFGLSACIINDITDLLWMPLLITPFLIMFTVTSIVCCVIIRILLKTNPH